MQRRFLSKLKFYSQQLHDLRHIKDKDLLELAKAEIEEVHHGRDEIINDYFRKNLPKSMIVEFRTGAGGDESALFVQELSQMYELFWDHLGWKKETMESVKANKGLRQISYRLDGNRFRFLQQEAGVHRVQRVPETETKGRIHTSTVTVAVLPEMEIANVIINEEDLEIQTFRASGKGGQHVNKTESAVRVKHIPSGLVVSCQDERSQHLNKAKCLKVLTFRLQQQESQSKSDLTMGKRKDQVGSGGRNERIRTFNYPQNRITDHRIAKSIPLHEFRPGSFAEDLIYQTPIECHQYGDLLAELTRLHEINLLQEKLDGSIYENLF
eukprot:NODE_115_length_18417_cov_0.666012.p8 type:complete len:325 gc:universal NODE_115_length_18417_cov_0.666012:14754-15728(+)